MPPSHPNQLDISLALPQPTESISLFPPLGLLTLSLDRTPNGPKNIKSESLPPLFETCHPLLLALE